MLLSKRTTPYALVLLSFLPASSFALDSFRADAGYLYSSSEKNETQIQSNLLQARLFFERVKLSNSHSLFLTDEQPISYISVTHSASSGQNDDLSNELSSVGYGIRLDSPNGKYTVGWNVQASNQWDVDTLDEFEGDSESTLLLLGVDFGKVEVRYSHGNSDAEQTFFKDERRYSTGLISSKTYYIYANIKSNSVDDKITVDYLTNTSSGLHYSIDVSVFRKSVSSIYQDLNYTTTNLGLNESTRTYDGATTLGNNKSDQYGVEIGVTHYTSRTFMFSYSARKEADEEGTETVSAGVGKFFTERLSASADLAFNEAGYSGQAGIMFRF